MTKEDQEAIEQWRPCKCGGKFRMVLGKLGIEHTKSYTCPKYDAMDLNALIKKQGDLALYLWKMEQHNEA